MKRIFLATAVMALAMLSACENLGLQENEQQDVISSGVSGGFHKVLFTATLDADTKTYLEYDALNNVYKTVWDDEDVITVYDPATGESEECPLMEGAGTQTAKFAGSLQADSYIAVYGSYNYMQYDGTIYIELPYWQSNNTSSYWDEQTQTEICTSSLWNNAFPMVAESSGKSFSFQNLCSVLRVSVTGNGEYLQSITVRSNDSDVYMSGYAEIDMDGYEPVLRFDGGNDYVEFSSWTTLSSTPADYYIVVPAQTYPGGITFELNAEEGVRTFAVNEDVTMGRSRIRNVNLSYSDGISQGENWGVCGSFTEWETDIPMSDNGDGWYVAYGIWMNTGDQFKLRKDGLWDGSEVGVEILYAALPYFMGIPTNTRVPAYSVEDGGNYDMSIYLAGNYDIWFNPSENSVFVMRNGVSPFDLPTMDNNLFRLMMTSIRPERAHLCM